eukprot:scaffold11.g3887.t1
MDARQAEEQARRRTTALTRMAWRHAAGPALALALALALAAAQPAPRGASATVSPESDRAALLKLRDAASNWAEWSAARGIRGWDDTTPMCIWTGVVCTPGGRVASLSLQCDACPLRLAGTLPPELGGLTELVTLNLEGNLMGGPLLDQYGDPGAFPALQNMYLHDNNLTGRLPESFGDPGALPSLLLLRLDRRAERRWHLSRPPPLLCSLPATWGEAAFPNLQILALQQNQLTGQVPDAWWSPSGMEAVEELYLQDNQLTGGLPPAWARPSAFRRLKYLFLSGNSLGGTLPPDGTIPSTWAAFPSLQRAIVRPGNAYLCAPIPPGLPFALCREDEPSCLRWQVTLTMPPCQAVPGEAPVAEVAPGAEPAAEEGQRALTSPFAAGALQAMRLTPPQPGKPQELPAGAAALAPTTPDARLPSSPPRSSSVTGSRSHSSAGSIIASHCTRIKTMSMTDLQEASSRAATGTAAGAGAGQAAEAGGAAGGAAGGGAARAGAAGGGPGHVEAGLPRGTPRSSEDELDAQAIGSSSTSSKARTPPEQLHPADTGSLDLGFSDWEIDPSEISIMKRPDGSDWELGSGGFGRVYKALRNGVQPVAVKVLDTSGNLRQMAAADFRRAGAASGRPGVPCWPTREVAILKACRDVNILQFVGAYIGPERTLLVMEIALDVARGLVFLHSRRIVHFDLKSPNILLSRDGTAKIADVGMAKILARDYVTGVVGTLAWAAPELLWGQRCTEKADIYSYGIVLWRVFAGTLAVAA